MMEALDQMLTEGLITPDMAYKCVQQLDYCLAVELAKARRDADTMYRFVCSGGIRGYRCAFGLFAFVLRDVAFYRMRLPESPSKSGNKSNKKNKKYKRKKDVMLVKVAEAEEMTLLTYCPFRTDGNPRNNFE